MLGLYQPPPIYAPYKRLRALFGYTKSNTTDSVSSARRIGVVRLQTKQGYDYAERRIGVGTAALFIIAKKAAPYGAAEVSQNGSPTTANGDSRSVAGARKSRNRHSSGLEPTSTGPTGCRRFGLGRLECPVLELTLRDYRPIELPPMLSGPPKGQPRPMLAW